MSSGTTNVGGGSLANCLETSIKGADVAIFFTFDDTGSPSYLMQQLCVSCIDMRGIEWWDTWKWDKMNWKHIKDLRTFHYLDELRPNLPILNQPHSATFRTACVCALILYVTV